jgi:microcystin-dependent protein
MKFKLSKITEIMTKKFLILSFIVLVSVNNLSNAQTNVTSSGMSIQGIARDDKNEALANIDQLDLTFMVYYLVGTSSSPTEILRSTATVRTDNFGVFSYVLNITMDHYNLISTQSAYLRVSAGNVVFSDEKLQAVPYAIHAQNGVPTGTVVAFIGSVVPSGWLLCDGSAIPNTPFTENLKTLLGANNTPDLRAMFLRGAGNGNGKIGPTLKQVVQDDMKSHLHAVNINTNTTGNHSHTINRRSNNSNGAYDSGDINRSENSASTTDRALVGTFQTNAVGNHAHNVNGNTANTGGEETRPINYGVNYIIKI